MEKHSMNVNAYRTETGFTTKGELVSTVELIVPAEHVITLREMHNLQEIRPVNYLLAIANKDSGEQRELNLHSKGSKMKGFVPVVVLTKRAEPSDDLNSLFAAETYDLTLNVEVAEDKAPLFDGDEEADQPDPEGEQAQEAKSETVVDVPELQPETLAAGVLNAPKDVPALPSSEEVQDADFRVLTAGDEPEPAAPAAAEETPAEFLARCNMAQLSILMTAVGFDVTDWDDPKRSNDEDTAEWRDLLVQNWERVEGTGGWAMVRDQLAHPAPVIDDLFDGDDMPFGPKGNAV